MFVATNGDHGIRVLINVPDGCPAVLPPVDVPHAETSDIVRCFDKLGPNSRTWWTSFLADQYFFLPNVPRITDLWTFDDDSDANTSDDDAAIAADADIERPIRADFQPVASLATVANGDLVATRVEFGPEVFWIAQVCGRNVAENKLQVCYYWRDEINNRKYIRDATCKGWCVPSDVLHHGFTLTQGNLIRKVTVRRISSALLNAPDT